MVGGKAKAAFGRGHWDGVLPSRLPKLLATVGSTHRIFTKLMACSFPTIAGYHFETTAGGSEPSNTCIFPCATHRNTSRTELPKNPADDQPLTFGEGRPNYPTRCILTPASSASSALDLMLAKAVRFQIENTSGSCEIQSPVRLRKLSLDWESIRSPLWKSREGPEATVDMELARIGIRPSLGSGRSP